MTLTVRLGFWPCLGPMHRFIVRPQATDSLRLTVRIVSWLHMADGLEVSASCASELDEAICPAKPRCWCGSCLDRAILAD